ncbi:MAG: SdpI family protein [Patescibacteria group bacterium]|nr:SdpI family protein [Patescibacteria group bacterium]
MNKLNFTLKTELIPITLIILSFIVAGYFYPVLPDKIPTHWNFSGQIDQYSNKTFGIFLIPVLNLIMYLFFLTLPAIDPKKERYAEFQNVYHIVKSIIIIFMTGVYALIIITSLGYNVPVNTIMPSAVGLMFMIMGNYMGKIKPNWFIGIKTPWTLSSEDNWNKTHRLGGKMFVVSGIILIVSATLQSSAQVTLILFMTAIIMAGLFPLIYSYLIFKNQK